MRRDLYVAEWLLLHWSEFVSTLDKDIGISKEKRIKYYSNHLNTLVNSLTAHSANWHHNVLLDVLTTSKNFYEEVLTSDELAKKDLIKAEIMRKSLISKLRQQIEDAKVEENLARANNGIISE